MAYTPTAQALSPVMGAGSKITIGINNPTLGLGYHVSFFAQPIIPPTVIGAPNDWTFTVSDAGEWEFLNDGGVWGGTNAGIIEEANALLTHLKAGYGSQFSLSVLRVEHWAPLAKVFRRCSPFPTIGAVAGTFASNPVGATDPALGNVTTLVLPTYQNAFANTKVGRMPVKLPGWEMNQPAKRLEGITSSTAATGIATAALTALIGYLSGTATRIVGHNGGQADNIASVGVAPSPRIARAVKLIS